ncbi:hypothetical protein [Myxococcus sp. CA039A]|uniref:hypothetical protein n=1 Tax=Myxococcus sp. CA039A TaxID=2741737 RepID=UPI00157A6841|nr:hypothetical protein [Myxococcus sp. CA039A]NTX54611.1 hypothetical protein [Myxococcus sp. CA039A]
MSPAAQRSSIREDLARVGEKCEAIGERADSAVRAAQQYAMDLHRLMESVREDIRGVGERMATAEQVRRLEEKVGQMDERLADVDRRVTEHKPVVEAMPKLADQVVALQKRVDEHDTLMKGVPDMAKRMTDGEHRASRMSGALWVVGALVALLGMAGLRELAAWFVRVGPPAVHFEEPAVPLRRRK